MACVKTRTIWNLNQNERDACIILSRMRAEDNEIFDKCDVNELIYATAEKLLNGEDPVEFAIEMLVGLYGEEKEDHFRNQYRNYLK